MKKVVSKDGTEIAYDRWGRGRPLILVDGALCSRSFGPMPKIASLLAEHFTVFMYDRRGRGDSSNGKMYSVDREIEDLDALIREAGGSVYLFGVSSGAALALKAAESKLDIAKLALYEPPFVYEKNSESSRLDHKTQLELRLSADRRGDAVKYFMVQMVGAPAFFAWLMSLLPMWKKLKAVAHTLPYDAAIMGNFTVPSEDISRITVPTLIAGGEKSPETLRRAVQGVADVLPNGTLQWLKGQSHNLAAKAIAPVLRSFFMNENL
ncbi:alpha/beta hydrolase [bacterium]|nr:alpha/beta hydrolase [bacterium]